MAAMLGLQKLKFPNNFRLKTQNTTHFARTWATTNRVGEQVQCICFRIPQYNLSINEYTFFDSKICE
jgi:hypothetical protein